MPIADSLCGAASSNMDADFQLQPDCLTDASRPALDSNSQAKVACCQSSESTDTLARLGSEGAASRKRSRQLDDFEVDVLLQSDLKMQRRRQVSWLNQLQFTQLRYICKAVWPLMLHSTCSERSNQ